MDEKKATNGIRNFLIILTTMLTGVMIGVLATSHIKSKGYETLEEKVTEVLNLVDREYVDVLDADTLGERLLSVILSELDPHSIYMTPKEKANTDEFIRGNFEGVGLVLRREGDTTFVGQILAGGPSEGSGLLPGDLIWSVDGVQVSGVNMPADSVVARLRGDRGSKVTVKVRRGATSYECKIVRGVVNHETVHCTARLDATTGYIALGSFSSTTYDEFCDALRSLQSQGMKNLVFDLRGNTGGSLDAAIGIADEMLPSGSLIVYTQGAHQRRENVYDGRGGLFTKGKIIVLVDEGSASASEVVSGALQDNDRALIAGRRTFGKGLVQRQFELKDGSSVLLTVARYYTPSGRSIQRPYTNGTDEYYRDYLEQLMEESYVDNPTMHITDSTPYHTVGGRVVYGGGGIFPDSLIAYRKDPAYGYYNRLSGKDLFGRVAFEQVRRHAAEWLRRYPDQKSFCRQFNVTDEMLSRLVALGEKEGIPLEQKSFDTLRRQMGNTIKAYIGNFLYGTDAFYQIHLETDEDIIKVKKIMSKI